jgi:hypothetical protein
MKIAYEYNMLNVQQASKLGLEPSSLSAASGCAVTAYDGEEPIGFGFVCANQEADYCIHVLPAYAGRQIDVNIRKLLKAGSGKGQWRKANSLCV